MATQRKSCKLLSDIEANREKKTRTTENKMTRLSRKRPKSNGTEARRKNVETAKDDWKK